MLHTSVYSYYRGGYSSVLVEKILRGGDIRGLLLLLLLFRLQQQQPQLVSPLSFLILIPTMQSLTPLLSLFTQAQLLDSYWHGFGAHHFCSGS